MPSSSLPPAAEVVPRLHVRDPDVLLKVLCWTTIVACALVVATFSFGRDQGIYALVGEGILRGRLPYRDVWDFKPPGIFFVYALAQGLFGKDMVAPRLLEVLVLLGNVAMMRRLGTLWFQSSTAGLVGAAVMALIHAQMDFWHTGQPETFGAGFTFLGLLLTLEGFERRPRLGAFVVGVMFGCAALLKPPLGGGALVSAAYLCERAHAARRFPRSLEPAAFVALGLALPPLLCLAWFAARGGYADLYWTLGVFTPGYTTLSWEGRRASDMLYHAIEEGFFKFSALGAAGVIAAIAIAPMARREREGVYLTLGVISMHLAGIAMQGKFFAYHYGATLPLISLIGGLGLYKLWRRCCTAGSGGMAAFFAFVAVAIPMRYAVRDLPQFFWERSLIRFQYLLKLSPYDSREAMDKDLAYVADYSLAADRAVALDLRSRTKAHDRIFVWGFEPAVYWLAERESASRFIYNVPQRCPWEAQRARRVLMEDLTKNAPRFMVVQARDVFPAVTGDTLDSKDSIPDFPEFQRFLDSGYTLARKIEDFEIYARVP